MAKSETYKVEVWKKMSDEDLAKSVIKKRNQQQENLDSFYICNIGKVLTKWQKWKEVCPEIECFYAVKCNNNKVLLKTLAAVGTSFDCASKQEIQTLIDIGVTSERIIFTHPHKPIADIKFAKENGVNQMVFDSIDEINKIHQICGNKFPRLVMRLYENTSNSLYSFGHKFGAKKGEIRELIAAVKKHEMCLIGLSFHCGSSNSNELYEHVIRSCKLAHDIALEYGYQIKMLDIGGGFCDDVEGMIGLEEVINTIRNALVATFTEAELSKFQLAAEPGRYFAHPAYNLISTVIGKRKIKSECNGAKLYYFVNDGVYGTFAMHLLRYNHQDPVILSDNGRNVTSCTIFGPTMSGLAIVVKETALPELMIGDYLMWKNKGDYTSVLQSGFNGFKTSEYHYVIWEDMRNVLKEMTNGDEIEGINFEEVL